MKAAIIEKQGRPVSPSVRFVEDYQPCGEPGRGQVRVRTLASALNHLDLWVGGGVPGMELSYPRVSGCDACGVVESVGEGVRDAWVGKKVIVNAAVRADVPAMPGVVPDEAIAPAYELIGEHFDGMHREMFCVPVDNVQAIGDDADPVEAAAYGLAFLTAYSMVVTKAQLRPGQSVLITGIGGGVAMASLAIAKHVGCEVVVTSRHQSKLDRAKELGADHCVLDAGEDWSRAVRGATGKRGVDVAVDSVGKATHLSCIKSLVRGGTYVTCGCTTGPDATTDLARVFWNQLRIVGSTMGTNEEFAQVAALYRHGKLVPIVDTVVPAQDAAKAFERLETQDQFGKVVIDWR